MISVADLELVFFDVDVDGAHRVGPAHAAAELPQQPLAPEPGRDDAGFDRVADRW